MEVYETVRCGNVWLWPLEMMSLCKQTGDVYQGSMVNVSIPGKGSVMSW